MVLAYRQGVAQTNMKIFKSSLTRLLTILLILLLVTYIIITTLNLNYPQVVQIEPRDNSINVGLSQYIKVEFHKDNSFTTQNDFKYQLSPDLETTSNFTDPKTLIIKPVYFFKDSTEYRLNLYFRNKLILSSSFTTKAPDALSENEQIEFQASAEYLYQESLKKVYEEKPWLEVLPIDIEQYVVVYDNNKHHLRIRIKQVLEENELQRLKEVIILKLQTNGIPDSIPLNWIFPKG